MSVQRISIPELQTDPATSVAFFTIKVSTAVRQWSTLRRYSQFLEMHNSLTTLFPAFTPPCVLPPKQFHLLPSVLRLKKEDSELEGRRAGLESYLRGIVNAGESSIEWTQSQQWRDFIAYPKPRTGSGAGSSGSSGVRDDAAKSPALVRSPTRAFSGDSAHSGSFMTSITALTSSSNGSSAWLSTHRNVEAQISNIRSMIRKKETDAEIKEALTRVIIAVEDLERGLDANADITDGELRRRRDLTRALWSDVKALEKASVKDLAKPLSSGRATPNLAASAHGGPERAMLLSESPKSASAPVRPASRRVFGNSALETAETRNVDNAGLVQLQNRHMQDQDAQLEALTSVIRRQKEIGLVIGEELDQQNQMLSEMETDVDRVQSKTKAATRIMDKIH